MRCGSRLLTYDRPVVMGILNATADSFYDGGRYGTEKQLLDHAEAMLEDGADIIDVGAVSTRPGAVLLSPEEEARRLSPLVAAIRRMAPDAVISVDTCFSLPARAAVEAGADIINDISGGAFDSDMFSVVASLSVPYILMHNPLGTRENPSGRGVEGECDLKSVVAELSQKNSQLHRMGVADVIIDPGFGFSKDLNQNYALMSRLGEMKRLFPNNPLLVALSRKSMIYRLLDTNPDDALVGTIALHAIALIQGAQMLRVHDVREARQTIDIIGKMMSLQ
ncbi:MAG: dihydropteroate synthase [Bacteroidales bacterium]|nr:dihydropteroate synthase [Bacteroidales bacterium]